MDSEWVLLSHQEHGATNSWNRFWWCIGAYKICSLLLITFWWIQQFSSSNTVYLFHTPFHCFRLTKNHWLMTVFIFYDSVPNLPVGDWWYAAISWWSPPMTPRKLACRHSSNWMLKLSWTLRPGCYVVLCLKNHIQSIRNSYLINGCII